MYRSLSILALSIALAIGPMSFNSSVARSATYEGALSLTSDSPQTVENTDSSKTPSSGATAQASAAAASNPVLKGSDNRGVAAETNRKKPRRARASGGLTRVQMQNVDFHVDDDIVLRIRDLRGALLRNNKATPPVFDDKESFSFRIDSGTIAISTDSLANLLNNYVFAYPKAPLEHIKLSVEENRIKMTGTIHKITDVHFEILGDLFATPEGKIQLHPTSIKTAGIPVKGLMNLFGIELEDLIKSTESRGVKVDDNDITLDPELMIPPPRVQGKITAVRIEGDEVIQSFGAANKASGGVTSRSTTSHRRGANFMYYRGGTIRFGKLTMTNADLKLIDQDPKNAFDFSMDHYNRQLVAGYSKSTRSFGLVVFMPDYSKVQAASSKNNTRTDTSKSLSKR